jgi:hypothetical protein
VTRPASAGHRIPQDRRADGALLSPQYPQSVTNINFPRDNTYEKPYILSGHYRKEIEQPREDPPWSIESTAAWPGRPERF